MFETPATPPSVPSASAIHGKVIRKRTYVSSGPTPRETSQSRLIHEAAYAAEKQGRQLLTDSLSISDVLKYERVSREAVSLLMKAVCLRNHAKELEKDGPSDKD
jgi:hypothetical protein